MTGVQKLHWEICKMRGWTRVDAGDGCSSIVNPFGMVLETSRHEEKLEDCILDWHADANWPTLFMELPRGTILMQFRSESPIRWAVCGCSSDSVVQFCERGDDLPTLVCNAWIQWKTGEDLLRDLKPSDLQQLQMAKPPDSVN